MTGDVLDPFRGWDEEDEDDIAELIDDAELNADWVLLADLLDD